MLEIKRALKLQGRIIIIAPNAPGMGATFWDDYKQRWIVSRKRLVDMTEEAGFEIVRIRYSIGYIALGEGPLWAFGQVVAHFTSTVLNLPLVNRLSESTRLDNFAAKVKKTIVELVAANCTNLLMAAEYPGNNWDHYLYTAERGLKQAFAFAGTTKATSIPLDCYMLWKNPTNYVAKLITGTFHLLLKVIFRMYGNNASIFTKRLASLGLT